MKVLDKTKKLLTNGEFNSICKNAISFKAKNKISKFCADSIDAEKSSILRSELSKFGLKEFEIVNLINIKPKGLVHLQIVIEEMSERLSEDQMKSILSLFK